MLASTDGEAGVNRFRAKLLTGMALVVIALTGTAMWLIERSVRAETRHDLQVEFAAELGLLRTVREIRYATLAERCRVLVRKPRIRAALEDNALDLLYPSAKDELGEPLPDTAAEDSELSLRPRFYRFIDNRGAVIRPFNAAEFGFLTPEEEKRLTFANVPQEQQHGAFARGAEVVEIIVTPILSIETGEATAALVTGFPVIMHQRSAAGLQSGLWLDESLHLPSLDYTTRRSLEADVSQALTRDDDAAAKGIPVRVQDAENMLFCERLNPGSALPPVHEVAIYSLADLLKRQNELRWRGLAGGAALLGLGVMASFYISAHLARPVRELATVSAENRVLRERAEEALKVTKDELARSARFSANASHQLKTPVAVLRAGLDELLAQPGLTDEMREELSVLVHQTFRLSSIIEDLMLLSRLESGRLQFDLKPVDLQHLVATCVDDLELLHDPSPQIESELPATLLILGEPRYTLLIVQNLLENACKYGRPGEPIRVSSHQGGETVMLVVANRGEPIPEASREQIFERFHRAAAGGNIPGHGLGLNLARELARLHGGDIRVIRSDEEWTEFEVSFRAALAVS